MYAKFYGTLSICIVSAILPFSFFLHDSSVAPNKQKEMAEQTVSFHNSGPGPERHCCGQAGTHLNMRVIEVTEIVETDRWFKCL